MTTRIEAETAEFSVEATLRVTLDSKGNVTSVTVHPEVGHLRALDSHGMVFHPDLTVNQHTLQLAQKRLGAKITQYLQDLPHKVFWDWGQKEVA